MKITKHITFISLFALFFSCDYVNEPLEKKSGGFDDTKCTDVTFAPNTNTKRNILIEDFTGHTCVGCPGAAYELEQIEAAHGDQVIGVAIHSGFFSEPRAAGSGKFESDYRSEDGNNLHDDFGPLPSYPKGMINRSDTVLNNGSKIFSKSEFSSAVNAFLNNTPLANLQMITSYDNTDGTLCVFVETEALTDLTGNYHLVIALTEDSIVDWQVNGSGANGHPGYPSGDVQYYVHNHVFRGNVNGLYGEEIVSGSLADTEKLISKYTYTIDPAWNDANINVIAYLMDFSTKEVIQVTKVHM